MIKEKYYRIIITWCISFQVQAQFINKHYTINDGLSHDITYQINQNNKGEIFIGTDDGLISFNGQNFKNYTYKKWFKI